LFNSEQQLLPKKHVSKTILAKNHEGVDILVEEAAEYHIPTSVQKVKYISESKQRLRAKKLKFLYFTNL